MCKCMQLLVKKGYIQPNLLNSKQFLIYPIITTGNKSKVGKTPLFINNCPNCGEKLGE